MTDPVQCPAPIAITMLVEVAARPGRDYGATRFLYEEIARPFRKQGGIPPSVLRWLSQAASGDPEVVATGLVDDLHRHGAWDQGAPS